MDACKCGGVCLTPSSHAGKSSLIHHVSVDSGHQPWPALARQQAYMTRCRYVDWGSKVCNIKVLTARHIR